MTTTNNNTNITKNMSPVNGHPLYYQIIYENGDRSDIRDSTLRSPKLPTHGPYLIKVEKNTLTDKPYSVKFSYNKDNFSLAFKNVLVDPHIKEDDIYYYLAFSEGW